MVRWLAGWNRHVTPPHTRSKGLLLHSVLLTPWVVVVVLSSFAKEGGGHPWYLGSPSGGAQHDRDAGCDGPGPSPVLRAVLHRHLGAVRLHHQGAGAALIDLSTHLPSHRQRLADDSKHGVMLSRNADD